MKPLYYILDFDSTIIQSETLDELGKISLFSEGLYAPYLFLIDDLCLKNELE